MKHTICIAIALFSSASLINAGNAFSGEKSTKVKIADLLTLRSRMLQEPDLNNDTLLERIDFFENFADQRLSVEKIPTAVDQAFEKLWKKRETINSDVYGAWDLIKDQQRENFEQNKKNIKPAIYRVLLKDRPDLLAQISQTNEETNATTTPDNTRQ